MIRQLMVILLSILMVSCARQTISPPPEKETMPEEKGIGPEVRMNAENFVSDGVAFYQDDNYNEAVSSWQKALELIPGDAEVHNFIGISYHKLNRLEDASTHFQIASDLDSNYYEAYNNLGYVRFLQKKYGDARKAFEKALQINPEYAAAKLNYDKTKKIMSGELQREVFELAEEAAKIEDVDKQIDLYEKLLELDTMNAEVHNNLGVAYYYADSLDGAYDHLNKALILNKAYPEAINNLGYVYKVAGRYQDAVGFFLHAVSLKPRYTIGLNNLGETYMLMKEYNNARRVFKTVLDIDPANEFAKDSIAQLQELDNSSN